MRKRVVITGMGIVAPNGIGLGEYERALREGRSGIRYIPEMAEKGFACQVAGVPPDFEEVIPRYLPPQELLSLRDNIGYAAVAAVDAWRDAGLEVPAYDEDRVDWDAGAIIGSGVGGIETIGRIVVPMVNEGRGKAHGEPDRGAGHVQWGKCHGLRAPGVRQPGDGQFFGMQYRERSYY